MCIHVPRIMRRRAAIRKGCRARISPSNGKRRAEVRPSLVCRGERGGQPAAFFTMAVIFVSSAGVSFVIAYEVGHMDPSSSWAASSKPSVA